MSIPLRYGTTVIMLKEQNNTKGYQFLLGTVQLTDEEIMQKVDAGINSS